MEKKREKNIFNNVIYSNTMKNIINYYMFFIISNTTYTHFKLLDDYIVSLC